MENLTGCWKTQFFSDLVAMQGLIAIFNDCKSLKMEQAGNHAFRRSMLKKVRMPFFNMLLIHTVRAHTRHLDGVGPCSEAHRVGAAADSLFHAYIVQFGGATARLADKKLTGADMTWMRAADKSVE